MSEQVYRPAAVNADGSLDMVKCQQDWMEIIERHERKRQAWVSRCEKISKVYADSETSTLSNAHRKYAVLWMVTQTRAPAIYAREPKCVVSRRYQSPDKDVRDAVIALERVTNIQISDSKLHAGILSARLDRLLPGRGVVWLEYEAKDDGQQVTEQRINAPHVHWKDFGHGEGQTWEKVDCTWRRTYFTEGKLKEKFGDDVMTRCEVTLDYAEKDAPENERQATVYQVWCKSRNAVYWIARTAKAALEVGEPPLKLKGFFPHPKPVFATLTNENCIPTPDYIYFQDQAEEITRLTKRIDRLTDNLKMVGVYPAGPSSEGRSEIERILQPGFENKMVPVPSWAAFAEKGGVNQIQYLPVKDVAFIIEACVKLRQQLLNDVDRITGSSDIMQGDTDPNETLGAQQLKSQYGMMRLKDTKDDFVRFAKEACEIIAEIAAEYFTAETLGRMASMSPYQTGPDGQPILDGETMMPAEAGWVRLLRNQLAREVLIDVETDSTVHPDEDAEKQRRVELFDALQKGMAPLVELQQANPMLAAAIVPLWGDALTFMLRGFRAGRELEETVEETVQKIVQLAQQQAQQAMNPQPPQPTIEEQLANKELDQTGQIENRKLDIEEQRLPIDMAAARAKIVAAHKPQLMRPQQSA